MSQILKLLQAAEIGVSSDPENMAYVLLFLTNDGTYRVISEYKISHKPIGPSRDFEEETDARKFFDSQCSLISELTADD